MAEIDQREHACLRLALLEQRCDDLREELEDMKKTFKSNYDEVKVVLQEIKNDQTAIRLQLQRQVGFFAGMTALAAGMIGLVGVGADWFGGK